MLEFCSCASDMEEEEEEVEEGEADECVACMEEEDEEEAAESRHSRLYVRLSASSSLSMAIWCQRLSLSEIQRGWVLLRGSVGRCTTGVILF